MCRDESFVRCLTSRPIHHHPSPVLVLIIGTILHEMMTYILSVGRWRRIGSRARSDGRTDAAGRHLMIATAAGRHAARLLFQFADHYNKWIGIQLDKVPKRIFVLYARDDWAERILKDCCLPAMVGHNSPPTTQHIKVIISVIIHFNHRTKVKRDIF